MREVPILFNTEMVQAILEGRKTQTRRIAKKLNHIVGDRPDGLPQSEFSFFVSPKTGWVYWKDVERQVLLNDKVLKAPCKPGDVFYVRETWSTHYDGIHPELVYCYKADGINLEAECLPGESNRWYPSIHMPREAARLFLKVKDVRVEHLRDMSNSDLANEGFGDWTRFISLWNSTIKPADCNKYDWNANPWVWVIVFERIERPASLEV